MVDILRLTGDICAASSSNCLCTSVTYHSLNLLHINSFAALLMLRSIGWRRSVQLAGMGNIIMLFSSRRAATALVCWPLQTSNSTKLLALVGEWDIFTFAACTEWDILPSMIHIFFNWLVVSVNVICKSLGNLCCQRQAVVLPWFVIWGGEEFSSHW